MHLKITASKLSIILIDRLKSHLNTHNLMTYNQSGCVKKCFEVVKNLGEHNKKVDWVKVNNEIATLKFSKEEMDYKKRVTTLSVSEELCDYITNTLPAELKEIYSSRVYPATALNFLVAAGYVSIVLNKNIDL